MAIRLAFVDRDGTINVERNHVHRRSDFDYLPRAVQGLRVLGSGGAKIIVVTNQAGIAKGLYSEADFHELTEWMMADLRMRGVTIDAVLYCPHHPDASVAQYRCSCDCRKPGTALLRAALQERDVSAADAVLIGDKNTDIDAGRALGIATCLVETGHGQAEKVTTRADFVATDLFAAATLLTSREIG